MCQQSWRWSSLQRMVGSARPLQTRRPRNLRNKRCMTSDSRSASRSGPLAGNTYVHCVMCLTAPSKLAQSKGCLGPAQLVWARCCSDMRSALSHFRGTLGRAGNTSMAHRLLKPRPTMPQLQGSHGNKPVNRWRRLSATTLQRHLPHPNANGLKGKPRCGQRHSHGGSWPLVT